MKRRDFLRLFGIPTSAITLAHWETNEAKAFSTWKLQPSKREAIMMIVVLAMHGAPPKDLPNLEIRQLVSLHMQLEQKGIPDPEHAEMESRYAELDAKVRAWPRTEHNDPFYAASQVLRAQLSEATGHEVLVGFNEFCAPSLEQILDQAVSQGADKVVVITPMMTPGGDHAEKDIPAAVEEARQRHRKVDFVYAWPFEVSQVAQFLAQQVKRY